jgi:hypothetical protein
LYLLLQTMPKDYSDTVIYKISCKDTSICESYVGHTVNFEQRRCQHERACNENKIHYKVYKYIRENGGWQNWEMVEIAKYNCKDAVEARRREQEHYDELKPSLNSVPPFPSYEVSSCLPCTSKEDVATLSDQTSYICSFCNFKTNRKNDYSRHLLTDKHIDKHKHFEIQQKQSQMMKDIQQTLRNDKEQTNQDTQKAQKPYQCLCGKSYTYDSGYYRHKRTCSNKPIVKDIDEQLMKHVCAIFKLLSSK